MADESAVAGQLEVCSAPSPGGRAATLSLGGERVVESAPFALACKPPSAPRAWLLPLVVLLMISAGCGKKEKASPKVMSRVDMQAALADKAKSSTSDAKAASATP